jgi:hypothetical protein
MYRTFHNFSKSKKSISTILAAVLLIIVVLIIAGLFFMFGRTLFTSLSAIHDFEIIDASLVLDSSGSATLLITCKNTGNSRISITSVSIGAWSSNWNQDLDPGQTAGKTFNPTGAFVSGQKVTVKVSAMYDSTPLEKIVQVVVQG